MHGLYKTFHKGLGDVWYYLLQPIASCLFIRDSSAPGAGQEGLATPIVPGMHLLLVAPLLKEFIDVFSNPVFPPDMHVTFYID